MSKHEKQTENIKTQRSITTFLIFKECDLNVNALRQNM
jgi:hypothetical protein